MASLSPSFILNDLHKKNQFENRSAFYLSLFSVIAGGFNPFIMADAKDAEIKPVMFDESANS